MEALQSILIQKEKGETCLMRETRIVWLTDIRYDDREKIISVIGPNALKAFAENGTINSYDSKSAPKEWETTVTADFSDIEDVLEKTQKQAESDLMLKIKSFKLRY